MIETKIISAANQADIRLKNDPFPLFGRLIPTYQYEQWSSREEIWNETKTMCFPDENYDYEKMQANTTFIGAYDGETCVGLAIMQDAWFDYWYLSDLKVSKDYRKQGIGKALMQKALEIALQKNYHGIYAICQDNNLAACRFYQSCGFVIGGFDSKVYHGTSQADKKDVIFYWDAPKK